MSSALSSSRWLGGTELSRAERQGAVGVATAAIISVGAIDYATGPLLSLSIFYLVPVAWVSAVVGRRAGVAAAGLSGAAGLLSDVVLQPHYRHRAIATWNVALMVVSLLVVVELVERVRARALAAQAAERRGREFLAFAAHQLRTPLAGIRSTADALMLGPGNDPDEELLLAGMTREADRAGRLVSSLLRVARIDQHEEMPLRVADVGQMVHGEVGRVRITSPHLAWDEDTGRVPIALRCNPDAVGEALANLLDNARRHAQTRVVVRARASAQDVLIEVEDDGAGLPISVAESAFDRFVTLDGHGGTGLGLPITRGIAEAHGGDVCYTGAAFVIRLPRR
jgi:signal transduction histidine kinase